MKKTLPIPVFIGLAVLCYLSACGLLSWSYFAYDDALHATSIYFWVYGGVILLEASLTDPADKKEQTEMPRWKQALLLLLCTAVAYIAVWEAGQYGINYFLYGVWFWWLAGLLVLWAAFVLYRHSRFRSPSPPRKARSPLHSAAVFLMIFFLPLLLTSLVFLAVLHPVTVKAITPIGEAEGGRFIGRITGDRSQNPLGVYFFADGDRWYYYDVLTGAPVSYDAPAYLHPAR